MADNYSKLIRKKLHAIADIVQKLWNYCDVLRDDGMSYEDYVEKLTYLLNLQEVMV